MIMKVTLLMMMVLLLMMVMMMVVVVDKEEDLELAAELAIPVTSFLQDSTCVVFIAKLSASQIKS